MKNPLFTLKEFNGSSFEQTGIPFTQGCIVPNLDEIGPAILEKILDFKILSMYFRYFRIISPFEKCGSFIWTNWNPLHLRIFSTKFGRNWPSSSGEDIFAISKLSILGKKAGPFIWINLNPLHPRMHCAKFCWNWPSGSWEQDEHVKSL